jgi:F0F1-type ATP synthase membrane subunit b/b'
MDYRQQRNDYIQRVHQLENDLAAAHKQSQLHKKRLDQTVLSHDARIMEFISEAQRSEMTYQAQLQNMQSEHTELMRELREQHDTEREVWHIQQKTLIDEVRRDLNFEKEEALRELNREWKDKSEDLQASMSKDAMEIQTHWESKLEKAKSKSAMKMSRLQGEIEVVKDRLGKEIERRKQNQAGLAEAIEKIKALETKYITCQSKCQALLKQRTITEKEMITVSSDKADGFLC